MITSIRYIAVHPLNDFSGSPRVLADFCSSKAVQSESLTVVTSGSNGFLYAGLGESQTIWYAVGSSQLLNTVSFVLAQIQLFWVIVWLAIRSWWRGEKVVVVNNTILCLGSVIASRCVGAFTISYLHELSISHSVVQNLTRKIAARVIHYTAHEVIFVSQFLSDHYPLNYRHRTVLPNGLRSDFTRATELDYATKFAQRRVLFVGSLRIYKGVHELVKIATCLPDIPFTAVFSCTDRELAMFFERLVVPDNLCLMARDRNIEKKYREAFLVLNLSLPKVCVEGFALTILEGLSMGCPCIVPPVGGHLDYFNDSAGIMLDARDTDTIVDFISQLQHDETRWRGYADAAQTIARGLTSEIYQQRVGELVDSIRQQYFPMDEN